MHAVQPAPVPESIGDKLQRLQADALETVHWVMLHLAKSLTNPQDAEPADQVTTQRARLCLQAARDLLRFRPPPEDEDDSTRPWSKPKQVHTPNTRSRTDAAAPAADAQGAQPRGKGSPRATALQQAGPLLAAAGAEASRFGERIDPPLTPKASTLAPTHGSAPLTHDSASPSFLAPSPSSVPAVISVVKSPPPPPKPTYFTRQEQLAIFAVMGKEGARLTHAQYNQITEWNVYAKAVGISLALGIKEAELNAHRPLEPAPPAAPPPN